MKTICKNLSLLALAFLMISLFTACDEDDDIQIDDPEFKIQIVQNSTFGNILVDQDNQSMYFFAGDVGGESNCNGGCADVWPAVTGEDYELKLGAGLQSSDFGTISRSGGEQQITYKGWPLYYFSPNADGVREAAGATEGDGRNGVFHIAKPDYTILLGSQPVEAGGDAVVYLVDDRGVSLYHNTADDTNSSNCNGGCAAVWPPFKSPAYVIPSTLHDYDFAEVTRIDELGPQLSYKGNPLYFFSQDEEQRGSVLGQGGGPNQTFFVATPEL